MQNDKITPFTIKVAQEVLSDLQLRLKNSRWSYQMEGTGWEAGTDLNCLKQFVAYRLDTYNWRERETAQWRDGLRQSARVLSSNSIVANRSCYGANSFRTRG